MGGFANFMSSLFDDAPFTMEDRQSFVDHVFSDLLSYRVYDPEDNLFHNDGTVGFLLETPPVIGADVFRTLQTASSIHLLGIAKSDAEPYPMVQPAPRSNPLDAQDGRTPDWSLQRPSLWHQWPYEVRSAFTSHFDFWVGRW